MTEQRGTLPLAKGVPQELLDAWEKRDKDGGIPCPFCDYCHTSPAVIWEHWKAKHRSKEAASKMDDMEFTIMRAREGLGTRPIVAVAIEGGVTTLTVTNIQGVEIVVWDWDNYKDATIDNKRQMLGAVTNPFARKRLGLDEAECELREPAFENGAWTCPPGYAYPSCPRCFHRYFYLKPEPSVGSASPDGGLCQWCCAELAQEEPQ